MIDSNENELHSLLEKFSPEKYSHLNMVSEAKGLCFVRKKSREQVLHELLIHSQSMKEKNIKAAGFDDLVIALKGISDENVSVLTGHNEDYGFEIYINSNLSMRLGFSLIKRRQKTDEEIQWERSLGIVHEKRN